MPRCLPESLKKRRESRPRSEMGGMRSMLFRRRMRTDGIGCRPSKFGSRPRVVRPSLPNMTGGGREGDPCPTQENVVLLARFLYDHLYDHCTIKPFVLADNWKTNTRLPPSTTPPHPTPPLTQLHNIMAPRRSHKKSRAGCTRCKTRRIKVLSYDCKLCGWFKLRCLFLSSFLFISTNIDGYPF